MQALLLPSRLPPPLLRQRALPAVASLASHPLNGAILPTGRLCFGGGEAAPRRFTAAAAAASSSSAGPLFPTPPPTEQTIERAKLEQVIKRLEKTARYFKNLGTLGFWSQLVCTFVSAGILSFSTVVTGKVTSPFTFYTTAAGVAAAFISVFWSFGYIRLSERLRKTASAPAKAPPRADVIKSLKNGIVLNILGMGAAVLVEFLEGFIAENSSVSVNGDELESNVFYPHHAQASANTILSHFLGLATSLELLRSVSIPPTEPAAT
ncbi:hypothetical protein D1007_24872 [Hordeum vulgare]|nr:hypothetical protein D1007_24872 [Hordeum vulgare]